MPDEELKGLLKRHLELAEDTNRMLHGMRRRAFLGTIFTIALWTIFIIVPAVTFYFYAAPYITQMKSFIEGTQKVQSQFSGTDPTSFLQSLYDQYLNTQAQ